MCFLLILEKMYMILPALLIKLVEIELVAIGCWLSRMAKDVFC